MIRRAFGTAVVAAGLLWPSLAAPQPELEAGSRYFLYLSDKRIVTLELVSGRRAVLNYINLDDAIEVLEAGNLVVVDTAGNTYRGHVFRADQELESGGFYFVSELIRPRQFRGYDIRGNFRFEQLPSRAYFRLGGRFVQLEPLTEEDFELVANKIGEIDLTAESKLALVDAGFWRGYGQLHTAGSDEARQLRPLFPDLDPVPPVVLENPAPRLASRFGSLPDPVVVQLRLTINRVGGLLNPEVIHSPDPALGEQAVETVRNSWVFLPALSKGEPVDAELVVRVVFDR